MGRKALTMDTTTAEDRSLWRQLVGTALTTRKSVSKSDPKAAAKPKAKSKARASPRSSALDYLRAMDKALQTMTGRTLADFIPGDESEGEYLLKPQPTLSVVIDQGSDGWSTMYYVLYKLKLRAILKFDIFHREHNDVSGAVKASGMWSSCILSGMVHNVNYGPWEGHKWFRQLLTGAQAYFSLAGPDDPLFKMLMSFVARDKGVDMGQFENHDEACDFLFAALRDGSCWDKKGPRTAFRRWFSWYGSQAWHDQFWHSRLLVILYLGLQMGVYTSIETLPTETSTLASAARTAAEAEEGDADEEARPDLREVDAAIAVELAAGKRADPEVEVKGPVSKGSDELQKYRDKCRNSLYVAGAIYGRPGLQDNCRMIFFVGKPLYDQHSINARDARGEAGMVEYYVSQARGSDPFASLAACVECAGITRDLGVLELMGFETSSADALHGGGGRVDPSDPMVADDDLRAVKLMVLVLNHIRFRTNSMSWHSDDLPGIIALWLSPYDEDHVRALAFVVTAYGNFLEACRRMAKIAYLRNLVRQSPFQQTFVKEFAMIAVSPSCETPAVRKQRLQEMARDAFCGLGQTKIVEDLFKQIRDREMRDTATKAVKLQRQMHIAFHSSTISEHRFPEPEYRTESSTAPPVPKRVFFSDDHTPPVDWESLVGPLTWPSLKPLNVPVLAAQGRLLDHVAELDTWDRVGLCWQAQFLPLGTVFHTVGSKDWCVSLGHAGLTAVRTFPLDKFVDGNEEVYFLSDGQFESMGWEFCLNLPSLEVLPTEIVSPSHSLCLPRGSKVAEGVCFLRSGEPMPVYQYAGRRAFWQLPKYILEKVAGLYRVPKKQSETVMLHQLLQNIFPDASEDEIASMMSLRGLTPIALESDEEEIPPEALEDLLPESDQKDVEDFFHFLERQSRGQDFLPESITWHSS